MYAKFYFTVKVFYTSKDVEMENDIELKLYKCFFFVLQNFNL